MQTLPTERLNADAPVPPEGMEQAADQAVKQPPPAETSALETVSNVIDGIGTVADVATSVLDIFS